MTQYPVLFNYPISRVLHTHVESILRWLRVLTAEPHLSGLDERLIGTFRSQQIGSYTSSSCMPREALLERALA